MRGLGTYKGVVLWVSTVCAWWRKRGGRIMLAKLHERLPETWNRLTATTQPCNAPKLANCWSHLHSESFLHRFALEKWHVQFSALPASCACHDIAHLDDIPASRHSLPVGAQIAISDRVSELQMSKPHEQVLCLVHANYVRNVGRLRAPAMRPIVEPV